MDMNKINNTSKARGEPGKIGKYQGKGEGVGEEQIAKCKEHRAVSKGPEARNQKPKYRLTGRDGPPELTIISGVPAWLASEGRDKERGRGQPPARTKPYYESVISMTVKSLSVDNGKKSALNREISRFLTYRDRQCFPRNDSRYQPISRGKPPLVEYDAFQREKPPEWEWHGKKLEVGNRELEVGRNELGEKEDKQNEI